MKYSLRSLFLFVTLAAVVLGSRIEYLRRWALFHEKEAARGKQMARGEIEIQELAGGKTQSLHEMLASDYRDAMTHPWTVVDESRDEPVILTMPRFKSPAPNPPKN